MASDKLKLVVYCLIIYLDSEGSRLPHNSLYNHREHTKFLSRERVNKKTKIINSLPLSTVVISYATLQRKPLFTSPA